MLNGRFLWKGGISNSDNKIDDAFSVLTLNVRSLLHPENEKVDLDWCYFRISLYRIINLSIV